MHARNKLKRLRNLYPSRQHGDIGDERDVAHQQIAFFPGIATENPQLSVVRNQAKHGIERGGLSRAVGADDSENAPLFDAEINTVERHGRAERLAQTACFNACHLESALLFFVRSL